MTSVKLRDFLSHNKNIALIYEVGGVIKAFIGIETRRSKVFKHGRIDFFCCDLSELDLREKNQILINVLRLAERDRISMLEHTPSKQNYSFFT